MLGHDYHSCDHHNTYDDQNFTFPGATSHYSETITILFKPCCMQLFPPPLLRSQLSPPSVHSKSTSTYQHMSPTETLTVMSAASQTLETASPISIPTLLQPAQPSAILLSHLELSRHTTTFLLQLLENLTTPIPRSLPQQIIAWSEDSPQPVIRTTSTTS